MVRMLIVYFSKEGNTERMANDIAEGARGVGMDVDVIPAEKAGVEGLDTYDALLIGSPTYFGAPAAEVKDFIDRSIKRFTRLEGKVGGAFTAAGGHGGGAATAIRSMLDMLLIHGMIIQGSSKGYNFGPIATMDPKDEARDECRNYGARLAKLTLRLNE